MNITQTSPNNVNFKGLLNPKLLEKALTEETAKDLIKRMNLDESFIKPKSIPIIEERQFEKFIECSMRKNLQMPKDLNENLNTGFSDKLKAHDILQDKFYKNNPIPAFKTNIDFKPKQKTGILANLSLKLNYLKQSVLGGLKSVGNIKTQEPVLEEGIIWSPWSKTPVAEPKIVWSPWSK